MLARKEERLLEQDAADPVVFVALADLPAVALDTRPHLHVRPGAVRNRERVPSEADGKQSGVREYPAAHDEVVRAVQLEQEQLARRERAEDTVPSGLPEVDFVKRRLRRKQLEPVAIGDADESLQARRSQWLLAGSSSLFAGRISTRPFIAPSALSASPRTCRRPRA